MEFISGFEIDEHPEQLVGGKVVVTLLILSRVFFAGLLLIIILRRLLVVKVVFLHEIVIEMLRRLLSMLNRLHPRFLQELQFLSEDFVALLDWVPEEQILNETWLEFWKHVGKVIHLLV